MPSGKSVLSELYARKTTLETDLSATELQLSRNMQERDQVDGALSVIFRRLRELRMDSLASGDIAPTEHADRTMLAILEQRKLEIDDLQQQLASQTTTRDSAIAQLDKHRLVLEQATTALSNGMEQLRQRLQAMPDWVAKDKSASSAQTWLSSLESKLAASRKEQVTKLKVYDADPLFSYLQGRGFLTPTYQANPIIRMMDLWVARLCNFTDGMRNYGILTALPGFLEGQVDNARKTADHATAEKLRVERLQAEDMGVTALELRLSAADAGFVDARDKVAQAKRELETTTASIAAYGQGNDRLHAEAEKAIDALFAGRTFDDLVALASNTPSEEDDDLVKESRRMRLQRDGLMTANQVLSKSLLKIQQDIEKVGKLISKFKHADYDDRYSSFGAGFLLATLLDSLESDRISTDQAWNSIQKSQEFDTPAPSPSSYTGSSSGGFGGGSFSSGGGFGGGGGFSTGGGF